MDPISMTLAVVPLAVGCGKICNRIHAFKNRFVDAPNTLLSIDADCTATRAALNQIQAVLGRMPRSSPQRAQDCMLKIAINRVIIACTNTISVLDEEIEELTREGDDMEIMDRIRFCFNETHMKELASQLQGHQSSLAFLMNILKTTSEFESFSLLQQQQEMMKKLLERSQRLRRLKPKRRPASDQVVDTEDTQSVIEYQQSLLSSEYLTARETASETGEERFSPVPEERSEYGGYSPRHSRFSSSSRSDTQSARVFSLPRGSVSMSEADEYQHGLPADWAHSDPFRKSGPPLPMRSFSKTTDRTLVSPTSNHGEETLMHEACEKGNLVMIKTLLDHDADPYAAYADPRKGFPKEAPQTKRKSSLLSIIKPSLKGKSQSQQTESTEWVTPLLIASGAGHVDIVKLLLSYRADPDYGTRSGMLPGRAGKKAEPAISKNPTALFEASEAGHVEVAKLLIQHGADVQARAGEHLMTPLHVAAANGHLIIVETIVRGWRPINIRDRSASVKERDRHFLAKVGRDTNAKSSFCLPSAEQGPDIEARDTELRTPVLLAAAGGHLDVLRFLIYRNADLQVTDKHNKGILLHAVESGSQEVVQMLLEHARSTSSSLKSQALGVLDPRNSSHLYNAAKLPEHPIQIAVEKGDTDITSLLIDFLQEDAANNFRTRPLSVSDPSLKNLMLSAPLQIATFNGNLGMVRILLDAGANVNRETVNGLRCTPLHIAAALGYDEIVKLLLERGAGVQLKDSNDKTAFDIAKSGSVKDLLECHAVTKGLQSLRFSNSSLQGHSPVREKIVVSHRYEPMGIYGRRRVPVYQE